LQTASIIRLLESLYAASLKSEKPYINLIYNSPPMKTNGDSPRETNVSAQLATNAMTIPHIKEEKFIILTPTTVDVRLLISFASTDNLDVKVPALFFGISKNGIGIRKSFLYVSLLILKVSFSATTVKSPPYIVHNI